MHKCRSSSRVRPGREHMLVLPRDSIMVQTNPKSVVRDRRGVCGVPVLERRLGRFLPRDRSLRMLRAAVVEPCSERGDPRMRRRATGLCLLLILAPQPEDGSHDSKQHQKQHQAGDQAGVIVAGIGTILVLDWLVLDSRDRAVWADVLAIWVVLREGGLRRCPILPCIRANRGVRRARVAPSGPQRRWFASRARVRGDVATGWADRGEGEPVGVLTQRAGLVGLIREQPRAVFGGRGRVDITLGPSCAGREPGVTAVPHGRPGARVFSPGVHHDNASGCRHSNPCRRSERSGCATL